jgi:hypothetical protein
MDIRSEAGMEFQGPETASADNSDFQVQARDSDGILHRKNQQTAA